MRYLLDQKQMKRIDSYSTEDIGIPSLVLMECAALKVVQCLETQLTKTDKIVAVVGSGNNGADAVAAVRILHNKGYDTAVVCVGNQTKQSDELKKQLDIIRNLHIAEYNINDIVFHDFDWIIDGILGIGLDRSVKGDLEKVIEKINQSGTNVCSVDIPSGVCAGAFQPEGKYICAHIAVTFGYDKIGMNLYPGREAVGQVYVEDIGFAKGALKAADPWVYALEKEDIDSLKPQRCSRSNKGTYGKTLIIAGSKHMGGAALLCARAAYKTGVGLVRVITAQENRSIIINGLPEAILETYSSDETINPNWINEQIQWADTIVIGPGLGKNQNALELLTCVLAQEKIPVVADADALNIIAENMSLLESHKCPLIVTPHPGEMSRLSGHSIDYIQSHLLEVCKNFADKYHLICLLKDAVTVISNGQSTALNLSGNNGMATGGSGDVLAGIIGGLVCQNSCSSTKKSLQLITALGAYIHGLAGDQAKKQCGFYGLLASDIIQYISYILL